MPLYVPFAFPASLFHVVVVLASVVSAVPQVVSTSSHCLPYVDFRSTFAILSFRFPLFSFPPYVALRVASVTPYVPLLLLLSSFPIPYVALRLVYVLHEIVHLAWLFSIVHPILSAGNFQSCSTTLLVVQVSTIAICVVL